MAKTNKVKGEGRNQSGWDDDDNDDHGNHQGGNDNQQGGHDDHHDGDDDHHGGDVDYHPVAYADRTLDPSAQDPAAPDTMIAGSGIPATHFGIVREETAGIELALHVHNRAGDPNEVHTDANGYADGVIHFEVQSGSVPWKPTNPIPIANWNFDFSVDAFKATSHLADFDLKLLVDVDPTANTDYLVFTRAPVGTSTANDHWTDQYGHTIFDNEGVANEVSQNSENYGFSPFNDTNPHLAGVQAYNFGPAHFDIQLLAFDAHHELVAQNHIVVDVLL